MESLHSTGSEKARKVNTEVKSTLINFFHIKGSVRKEFVLAGQTVPHITVTFYGDCVKMCEDFARNFGDKRVGSCITTQCLTLPFAPGKF
jgi:hypothetical protein